MALVSKKCNKRIYFLNILMKSGSCGAGNLAMGQLKCCCAVLSLHPRWLLKDTELFVTVTKHSQLPLKRKEREIH